jgi:exosortase A
MTARWKSHLLALTASIITTLILLHRDVADMATIWWDSSTYNHQMFIVPIIGWLIWQRKDELASHAPRAFWWGLTLVVAAGFGWALGEAGGISLFRHAALVLMIQALVLTICGPTIVRALLFPLFYLIFLIPIGEELVPLLQTITAKLCMVFLHLIGITAKIDGVFITTPVGLFEVAEACSGVKFLVAMAAYSVLAANVCFKNWKPRIPFLMMANIVPVFANGFRAFSTIWISNATGSTDFAASFDHVIYGWVFFAVVMVVVMAIGWRWFNRKNSDQWIADVAPDTRPSTKLWLKSGAALALFLGLVGGQQALASLGRRAMPQALELPNVPGWQRAQIAQSYPWLPRFDGVDHLLWGEYVNQAGDRVDLVIAAYAWQEDHREIVGYGQGAFDPRTSWSWMHDTASPVGGKAEMIRSPAGSREVASFYWINGTLTGSGTRVKLETLKTRLFGRDQAAAAVLISAEDSEAKHSRPAIDAFLAALGPVDGLTRATITTARGGG